MGKQQSGYIPDNAWAYNQENPGHAWGCPCGFSGKFASCCAHRRGYKKRPDCKGRMFVVDHDETARESPPPVEVELPSIPEDITDPEEIARLMLGGAAGSDITNGDAPRESFWNTLSTLPDFDTDQPGDDGDPGASNADGWDGDVGDGDWKIEPPSDTQELVQDKIGVTLPQDIWSYYEWMSGQGWHQGDGSFSAWCADLLYDHLRSCYGIALTMVHVEDVEKIA